MEKVKSLALILGVLAMSILVGYLVLAWVEPTQAPPGGNVPAPLNVGPIQQWKEGGLGVGTKTFDLASGQIAASKFYDRDDSSWYIDPSNTGYSALFRGNVGIGTTTPAYKLDVKGSINAEKIYVGGSEIGVGGGCSDVPGAQNCWQDIDGDSYTPGYKDCDETCPTCYMGSEYGTGTPDGKDQNCNGVMDEYVSKICYTDSGAGG